MDTYTHTITDDGRKYAAPVEAALPFGFLSEGAA